MSLDEFRNLKLPKNEFRKLSRRILGQYHNNLNFERDTYSTDEILAIFRNSVPNIDDDLIYKNLKQTKSYKKSKRSIGGIIGTSLVALIFGSSFLYGIVTTCNRLNEEHTQEREKNELDSVYQNALVKYGDLDGDGFVSFKEETDFNRRLFSGKGVESKSSFTKSGIRYDSHFKDFLLRYLNGDYVPRKTIIDWLKNYRE